MLKYRLARESGSTYKIEEHALADAQRAIRLIRSRAAEWKVNPARIGIMGFSAGGHLASTAATHFNHNYISNEKNINLRPDFAILIYPVISFQNDIAHTGSRDQLIGKDASKEMTDSFSNELQVNDRTPPSFLVQATDDDVVPVMNSIVFYEALIKYKIPAEMHLYKSGGHGFGMNNPTTNDQWMERCRNWMKSMKLLPE